MWQTQVRPLSGGGAEEPSSQLRQHSSHACWRRPAHRALCLPAGAMLRFLRAMVMEEGWALEEVLPLMTRNPAARLKLERKGRIAVGCDADILLLEVRGQGRRAGAVCGRTASPGGMLVMQHAATGPSCPGTHPPRPCRRTLWPCSTWWLEARW